jgi:cation diffusion facilitator family transporter
MSPARRTALFSLVAALGLAVAKLVVGLATGSLAILAEAAHSAVDMAAALIAYLAVSVAERPADPEHQYGHGKAQNLSALAEAAILGGVAVYIGVEAVIRLTESNPPTVDAAWYAFVLMGAVLVVDASRALIARRQGARTRSAALSASAWHFGSDFAGTAAVLIGLAAVRAGLPGADAVAALFVAVLVVLAAVRLAVVNLAPLMDRAPAGLQERIAGVVRSVPGVREVRSVRVREAGGDVFADVVIGVERLESLERSHHTMDAVEDAVEDVVGHTRVTVHVEPTAGAERASERVAAASLRVRGVMEVHNVTVLVDEHGRSITLHARVDERLSLREAEAIVERLRREITAEVGAARVYVHVEPFAPDAQAAADVTASEPALRGRATAAARDAAATDAEVALYRQGDRLLVVTKIAADPGLSVRDGHLLAGRVEEAVRAAIPDVSEVIVEVDARAARRAEAAPRG